MNPKEEKKTSWRQKVNRVEKKIIDVPFNLKSKFGDGNMLIPSALEMEILILNIPLGKVLSIDKFRELMAIDHGVSLSCPLSTGIFLRMLAETSFEENYSIPFWRVVTTKGELFPKFPGGTVFQQSRLIDEGVEFFTSVFPKVKDEYLM